MYRKFQSFLERSGFAKNTVSAYVETVRLFLARYGRVSEKSLCDYKVFLIEHYKPKTVNLRLHAINKYLEFIHMDSYKIKGIKDPQRAFLENVISDADYRYLKQRLKDGGYDQWYFTVWFMGGTGARVSELLQMKVEHVRAGYVDLYTKGGKVRRIYIPDKLRKEAEQWLRKEGIDSGYLFRNRYGEPLSARGLAFRLKGFAHQFGLDPKVVHPHAFRHTMASMLYYNKVDTISISKRLGHAQPSTTANIYAHVIEEADQRNADILSDIFLKRA